MAFQDLQQKIPPHRHAARERTRSGAAASAVFAGLATALTLLWLAQGVGTDGTLDRWHGNVATSAPQGSG
jgi:ferric-dicitrate binding protein FerR (iron transport regulator)